MEPLSPSRHQIGIETDRDSDRCIGRFSIGEPGPSVVLIGAIHGNEPAGAYAIRNVLDELEKRRLPVRGQITGIVGNLSGFSAGRRFLARDLNRRWLREEIAALSRAEESRISAEDDEQRELLRLIAPIMASSTEPVVFLDLHSTSGPGVPFCCMADVLRNRPIAFALPIPLILGIEEMLEGSMLGYLCDLGHIGIAVEGGQNDHPSTIRHHEASIWLTLVACGALSERDVPSLDAHRRRLAEASKGIESVVEIRDRHAVRENDAFVMNPGFENFSPLRRAQIVAHDRHGPIAAAEDGLLLMPRYQGQGDDGFFLARPVRRFWLRVSSILRAMRAERLVPFLPGVRRHPDDPDRFIVDSRIARYQTVNLFHLLGFRHARGEGEGLVFSRRRPGFQGVRALPDELIPFVTPPQRE